MTGLRISHSFIHLPKYFCSTYHVEGMVWIRVGKLLPWAKCGPLAIFVNKDLLKYNHAHTFIYCLWLFLPYNGKIK